MPRNGRKMLSSAEPMVVLEALLWIGGNHRRDLGATPPNVSMEDRDVAELVASVRQRPAVQRTLEELSCSENQYVRQAVRLAAQELGK
jgi:hypothetical protein